jgi:predicted esterase
MRWWRRSAVEALVIAGGLSPAASVATVDHAGTPAAGAAHDDVRSPAASTGGGAPATATETTESEPKASLSDARLALSPDGHFGAWLVAGTFDKNKRPDEEHLAPRLGAPVGDTRWVLASAARAPLDLVAALDAHVRDRIAYAGGVMHIERGGHHVLLLGVDDGVSVLVDGKRVFSHDEARPLRDDDDLVPLELAAGDHTIVLALHQWIGAWVFRARLLDPELEPPLGARWVLPGAAGQEANLASRMSVVTFDRGLAADGYHPVVTVRYPEGAPVGADLGLRARLVRKIDASADRADAGPVDDEALFDVDAGQVPIGDRGVADLSVALPRVAADEVEDRDWNVHAEVAGRPLDLPMHPRRAVREAVTHAERSLAEGRADPSSWLPASSADSVEFLRDRLVGLVGHGDGDLQAQADDARELDDLASAMDTKRDPYAGRTGPMRRAYRSPADGKLSEFALYVPPGFKPSRKYPLIVALHGMNGRPMEMLMWLFGHDDPDHDGNWEDRHPRKNLEPLDAIVVAPDGHYNAMYRDLGEEDVMRVTDWAAANYPIDPSRVTVTGPSMGGIGSAACALHHPDRFAAAEPLCGYHSLLIRELGWMRPWERFLAEVQSNVLWAENGQYLPLYIVHGTKDLPEENSGVLIDRYDELHYDVKHEHPELGHNVWQPTYEDLKGAKWLLDHRRPAHPRALRFKTARTRWGDDAWLHVRELSSSTAWGEVFARVDKDNVIHAAAHGINALGFDRDPALLDDAAAVTVGIDQSKLTFQAGEPIELYRDHGSWKAGPAPHEGDYKHGTITGPVHDVFHEPLLFVWGASDPAQARANEEAARAWARVRSGVRVDYPVLSDAEFFARGEPIANDRALFLVGNAASNRVVRELEPSFPIRVDGDDIILGATRIEPDDGPAADSQLGAVFIRPNPRRPDRYVVVVEGVGPLGTWRSLSLPEMLPDYIVFDHGVQASRGLLTLGAGAARAAGNFGNDWSLPAK